MPLYVTVAIVLYRADDIFKEDCDMASLHCLLSQVIEDFKSFRTTFNIQYSSIYFIINEMSAFVL